jgi:hypothetical protein
MRQEIELFLGGKSVEFAEPPEILFSYIRTDYTDPTVLRNSYSKTLTIEGTPNNNQIFNSIYHLDKISDYGTFNPAKRMEFQLFSNGDILEQGYAKLDKINKNEKNITYDITLYGGLGEFLYNLSYDQTAEGSDTSRGGGEDRRLSSLVFYDETEPNQEFDFNITKETVAEAWDALEKGTGATKWQYINFAPAYNGYPKDFDADKVLINTQGSSMPVTYNNNGTTGTTANATDKGGFPKTLIDGEQTYRTYNNYALGEMPKEMTEWEMRDLRSYLQRPVMSVKGFMEAVSNPVNNGGYTVELDQDFFNDNNPYYSKAWVTLPQLKKDEVEAGQSAKTEAANDVLSVSSEIGESYDVKYYLQGLEPGAVYSDVEVTFQFSVDVSGMPNQLLTTAIDYNAGGLWRKDAGYFSSIFVQLIGEDESGNAIAGSPIYNFTTPYGNQESSTWSWIPIGNDWEGPQNNVCSRSYFGTAYTPTLLTTDEVVKGRFVRTSGNHYVWKNVNGNVATLTAKLDNRMEYHRVYFRVTKVMRWRDYKNNGDPKLNNKEKEIFSGLTGDGVRENILMSWSGDSLVAKTAITQAEVVGSQVKYTVVSDVVRSGDHISKGDLLNFDGTPCDYLLSYCKLFNLYLSKDTYEKKIYIRTRDSFYNGGTIDLDQFIDRSKEIKVNPLAMESRWYDFAYPEEEQCGAAEDYDFNYGVEYGKNKVQTTYEFDSAAKNLFDDNIYQNAVEVQESSKYFTLRTVRFNPRATYGGIKTVPTFLYNSIDYKLFGESVDDTLSSCAILPPTGYTQTGYTSANGKEDWLPKLQLNNENDPIDGTNILCFYGGFQSSPYVGGQQVIYYLTDDIAEMFMVNGETPCWLWTKGEFNGNQRIAKGMTKLPVFSRMLYDYDRGQKTIQYTWDFGRVRNTYVPVKNYFDKSTIYERWWADYIADLYDANTRVVEAYVKMEGKVVGDWLRAMYWWDNCYWALTEINDYNITSYATTRCKFVKVNDIANYTSGITPPTAVTPTATLVPDKYIIDASGETITARVVTSDGGAWHIEYPSYVHPSQVAGTGDTTITLRFDSNPNPDGRDFDIRAYRTVGTSTHFWQQGTESTDKQLSLSNKTFVLGGGAGTFGTIINYKNRGSDTVTVTTTADWFEVSTPLSWDGDSGQIYFSITGTNDTEEVISATVTFTAVNDPSLTETMIIDWLPRELHFGGNGGSKTLTLLNNGLQVTAQNGYWASFTTTEHTITFNAPSNLAVTQRRELDLVSYMNSGATNATMPGGYIWLIQDGGGSDLKVEPDVLYYDTSGGGKYVTVTCSNSWAVTSKPAWVTLTSMDGSPGQTMLLVTAAESEEPYSRSGEIIFSDGRGTATLTVQQLGNSTVRAMSANPQTVMAISNPSSYTVDVFYANRSGDFVSIIPSENVDWYSASTIAWTGDTGRFTLYVADNESVDGRNVSLVLSAITGEVSTTVVLQQAGDQPYINLVPSAMTYDATGGTKTLTADSNVPWDIDINDTE